MDNAFKVLVTGKTSRIGNAFVEYLNREYPEEMEIDRVSLRDGSWKESDWSGYDAVLHAVGVSKTDEGPLESGVEEHYYSINRDLSIEAAQKAKNDGVRHFVYLSTMMVYGNSAPIGRKFTIDKDTVPAPDSVYGKSKLEGERGVLKLRDKGFEVTVIREPVVYGPHIDGELKKLFELSRVLPFFPRIESAKSYIYEDNLAELFRQVLIRRKGGVICPQNSELPTTSDLFLVMRRIRGRRCLQIGGLQGLLKFMSHFTRYVNAVFNDMKYTPELSKVDDLDYQIYSLEESLRRCLR